MKVRAMTVLLVNLMAAATERELPVQHGGAVPGFSEYQVKAAFVYNFTKFVEWPANAFETDDAPIVLGVIGQDPFGGELQSAVRNKQVDGRSFVLRRCANAADTRGCHLLFISTSERKRLGDLLAAVKDRPVLTIGETEGFIESGGIINFIMDKNEQRVRFEINNHAARQAGLLINSKLLALARRIEH